MEPPFKNGPIVSLFTDDLDQHPLLSSAVKLAVEDLLPPSKIQLAVGNGDDHFAPHHLPFDVRIGIIFPCVIVPVLVERFMRRQPLQKKRRNPLTTPARRR